VIVVSEIWCWVSGVGFYGLCLMLVSWLELSSKSSDGRNMFDLGLRVVLEVGFMVVSDNGGVGGK